MSATAERVALVGLALVAFAGCAPKRDFAAAPTEAVAKSEVSDPLGELAMLEQRMRALGLEPATPRRDKSLELQEAEPQPDEAVEESEPVERETKRDGGVDDRLQQGGGGGQSATAAPPPHEVPSPTQPMAMGDCEGENRCTTLCELSEAICQLEVQICSMAKDHEGDPIYVDACERAVEDCELSGDACNECSE